MFALDSYSMGWKANKTPAKCSIYSRGYVYYGVWSKKMKDFIEIQMLLQKLFCPIVNMWVSKYVLERGRTAAFSTPLFPYFFTLLTQCRFVFDKNWFITFTSVS